MKSTTSEDEPTTELAQLRREVERLRQELEQARAAAQPASEAGGSAEPALVRDPERLLTVLDALPIGVWFTDAQGTIIFGNEAGKRIWNGARYVGPEGYEEYKAWWADSGKRVTADEWAMARALKQGETNLDQVIEIEAFDGTRKVILNSAFPLYEDGGIVGGVALNEDITERRHSEEVLRRTEERLRLHVENSPLAVLEWTPDQGIIRWTGQAAEFFGWDAQEAVGKTFDQLGIIYEEDRERVSRDLAELAQGNVPRSINENRNCRKDGTVIWCRWNNSALRRPDGALISVLSLGLDVTGRVRAEQALRESEARLRRVIGISGLGVAFWEEDGRVTEVNDAYLGLTGYSHDDIRQGRVNWWDLTPPEFQGITRQSTEQIRKDDAPTPFQFETVVIRKDGERVPALLTGNVLGRRADGQLHGVVFLVDISEQKHAEEALKDAEQQLRQLVQSLPQLIWASTHEGQLDYLSPQWVAYTGVPAEDQLGMNWIHALHPDDRKGVARSWCAAVGGHIAYDLEFRIRRADGQYRWFKTRGVPIRDADGRILRWFGSCTDIDDQKRAEQALRDADRRKDEFLAMLSHELRNPLAAIVSAIEMLRRCGTQDPVLRRAGDIAERQARHMTRMVNDLLDVSRVTRGLVALHPERVDLRAVAERVVEEMRPAFQARHQEITLTVPMNPVESEADPVRLAQIATNLMDNACKYTPQGGHIWVTVEREADDALLRVCDNGIGIAPDLLPRVFDLFAQGERTLDRTQGGLGIGLTLVRSLVEQHGGSLSAYSEGPGKGSEFVVRIPALPQPSKGAAAERQPDSHAPGTRRILVVEDTADTAEMLAELLQTEGYEVTVAHNGSEALDAAAEKLPDVVLMDIGLPGMDGYEVARRLRAAHGEKAPALVAVTGYGMEEDRARAHEAGFACHLTKPVDLEQLLKALNGLQSE